MTRWWEDPAERARWIATIEKWRARDTGAYFVLHVAPEFVGVHDARHAVRLFDADGPMAMPAPLANLLGSPA